MGPAILPGIKDTVFSSRKRGSQSASSTRLPGGVSKREECRRRGLRRGPRLSHRVEGVRGAPKAASLPGAARPGCGCCGPAGVCLGLRCVALGGGGAVRCGSCSADSAKRAQRARDSDYKSRKPSRPSMCDGDTRLRGSWGGRGAPPPVGD